MTSTHKIRPMSSLFRGNILSGSSVSSISKDYINIDPQYDNSTV
jgi:hypothetical protein